MRAAAAMAAREVSVSREDSDEATLSGFHSETNAGRGRVVAKGRWKKGRNRTNGKEEGEGGRTRG